MLDDLSDNLTVASNMKSLAEAPKDLGNMYDRTIEEIKSLYQIHKNIAWISFIGLFMLLGP